MISVREPEPFRCWGYPCAFSQRENLRRGGATRPDHRGFPRRMTSEQRREVAREAGVAVIYDLDGAQVLVVEVEGRRQAGRLPAASAATPASWRSKKITTRIG